ncbi:MAG: ComEC/Rec2 family competence protein [Cardiobacterium sp.]|nr:MAG: ComEC/Rec2 family competence protein [Cardiobacterium sp.]
MRPSPLDLTLLAVAAGIALAWQSAPPLWLLPLALILLYPRVSRYPAIALLAAFWTHSPWQYTAPLTVDTRCTATLRVDDFPARGYPVGSRFTAVITAPGDCPLATGDRLTVSDYQPTAHQAGDNLRARLHLKPDNGSTANQRQRLRGYATLDNADTLTDAPVPWFIRQRLALAARIDRTFPPDQRPWLRALLLGDRSGLNSDAQNRLRRSGTAHLIAISGLHLALIAGLIYLALRPLLASLPPRWRQGIQPRTIALHGTLAVSLVYALLTGAAAPVLRAWMMLAAVVLCWHIPVISSRDALKLAALGVLLQNPWQLGAAGAWLSFSAVAIILYSAPLWRRMRPLKQWLVLQTLITALLTPLGWALFGGISLIAPIANLILIPWLAPVLTLALLALILPVFATPASWLLDHYLRALAQLARFAYAYVQPPWQPSTATALLFTVACLLTLARLRQPLLFERVENGGRLRTCLANRPYYLFTAPPLWFALTVAVALITTFAPAGDYHAPNGSAILRANGKTLIHNTGLRSRNHGRDDAARYLLPELRRHATHPDAIVLTSKSLRDISALKTLLETYPGTPVYSTLPLPDLPWDIRYCPTHNLAGITFEKSRDGCSARFAGQTL